MRRSLSNPGGRPRPWGDTATARTLVRCFDVEPVEKLRVTHGFHAYPGRMHPEIAERVIAEFAPKRVIDPFMGSGTVAVEALRAGLPFFGSDVSRVALEIAWTRTRVLVPAECRRVEEAGIRIEKLARANRDEVLPIPKWAEEHAHWYEPPTLGEIGLLKALIDEERDARLQRLLLCVLSSLLVKLSKQTSDSVTIPDQAARPWPPRAAYKLFREKCADLTKSLLLLSSDLHKRKIQPPEPEFKLADAREVKPPPGDLVLTSPPYAGTYDYSGHHALRFALYGEQGFALAHEIGARRAYGANYREDFTAALRRMLAASPTVVLLIGDGSVQNARVEADRLVRNIAVELGAKVPAGASRDQSEWAYGRRGERRREHLILISSPRAAAPTA